ncbi:unnamed protein product [Ambrosiozyma monospora]|uniref:Unnamed protein product n=1 Tax=Ambrosiozyma monospora TaxID=43982 RepID=A0A9W7DDT7_AMBMO|nr:unnamed protein product [Ambrosiozyma monospora]
MNSAPITDNAKTPDLTQQDGESAQTLSTTLATQENERDQQQQQQQQIPESLQLFSKLVSQITPEQIESKAVSDFLKQQKESPFNGAGNGNADGNCEKVTILDKIPSYDWEILSVTFESIFNEYTNEMKEVIQELENVDYRRNLWQESAHGKDAAKANQRFNKIEEWITNSEGYLESLRQDLLSSVNVIKSTMYKFDESPNNGNGGSDELNKNALATSSGPASTTITTTETPGVFENA